MNTTIKIRKRIFLIIVIAIVMLAIPLAMSSTLALFSGTDDQSVALIQQIDANYEPIAESIWAPETDTAETLLFALQSLIGIGIIATYVIYSEKKKSKKAC